MLGVVAEEEDDDRSTDTAAAVSMRRRDSDDSCMRRSFFLFAHALLITNSQVEGRFAAQLCAGIQAIGVKRASSPGVQCVQCSCGVSTVSTLQYYGRVNILFRSSSSVLPRACANGKVNFLVNTSHRDGKSYCDQRDKTCHATTLDSALLELLAGALAGGGGGKVLPAVERSLDRS